MRFALRHHLSFSNTPAICRNLVVGCAIISGSNAHAQTTTTAPCGIGFGADTACGIIVEVTNVDAFVTLTGQGPYDGVDDTLVGVVNNSNTPITSIGLTSPNPIFAFDGDGINTYGAPGNSKDNTGYGGPNAYFSTISHDSLSGIVNFINPIPPGGASYFSLENSLGEATACTTLLSGLKLTPQLSGFSLEGFPIYISASFTPPGNYTLAEAAALCGFTEFDWQQFILHLPDPSPFCEVNPSDLSQPDSSPNCGTNLKPPYPIHITSKSVPVYDPPQNGWTFGFYNGYPYYYPSNELQTLCADHRGISCQVPVITGGGTTLNFFDPPSDPCIAGPGGLPSLAFVLASWRAKCNDMTTQEGEYIAFDTHLVGVKRDNSPIDLGIGFLWTTNYNGTFGGIESLGGAGANADIPGTGGITLLHVNNIASYKGPKLVAVTAINGIPVGNPNLRLLAGDEVAARYREKHKESDRDEIRGSQVQQIEAEIVIRNVSNAVIAGPFQIVLESLRSDITLTNASGIFGGFPYLTLSNVSALQPGQVARTIATFDVPVEHPQERDDEEESRHKRLQLFPIVYQGRFN